MAPHDHGTKVSFPAGAAEFDIPVEIQHLPVRKHSPTQDCGPARAVEMRAWLVVD
jgi:hypothetical protein